MNHFSLRRISVGAAALTLLVGAAGAQQGGLVKEMVQNKLAAIKEASAKNKAALQTYTWTETIQFSMNGEVKSTKQMSCRYGPDGKVARTPIGPPPQEKKEGPIRQRMMEKAKEDAEAYMAKVKAVVGLYVPPDAQKMEQAFQAGNVSVGRPGAGEAGLDFKSYAKPGDTMAVDFDMQTKKLAALNVGSYLDDPSQPITLAVKFSALPDGTNTPGSIVLNAPSKSIQVTITNADYKKL